ncbi:hypothetical protein E2542_SST05847 [Spatholobus suberectus]|nr:hypothetical protein E2542_SST05847 [Spatholobus suberectus]
MNQNQNETKPNPLTVTEGSVRVWACATRAEAVFSCWRGGGYGILLANRKTTSKNKADLGRWCSDGGKGGAVGSKKRSRSKKRNKKNYVAAPNAGTEAVGAPAAESSALNAPRLNQLHQMHQHRLKFLNLSHKLKHHKFQLHEDFKEHRALEVGFMITVEVGLLIWIPDISKFDFGILICWFAEIGKRGVRSWSSIGCEININEIVMLPQMQ